MITLLLEPQSSKVCGVRGALSEAVLRRLTGDDRSNEPNLELNHATLARDAVAHADDVIRDEDIQLSLFLLYSSAAGSFGEFDAELEWDLSLIEARRVLELAFERALRETVAVPKLPEPRSDAVARVLFGMSEEDSGPSLSRYFAKQATRAQALEFLKQRSIYTLREADPHSWAIPRLHGPAKAALVEIQSDEYGGGRPERVHAEIFAKTMRGAGLDDRYGAYLDAVPAITLASFNMMMMFGVNRRLLGACIGHLAAFEMTSSIPCSLYAAGLRRLGFGDDVTDYYDEHIEADAVHEQIAARDLAGALAEDQPELLHDILFGAAACLAVDGAVSTHILERWQQGESSLRPIELVTRK